MSIATISERPWADNNASSGCSFKIGTIGVHSRSWWDGAIDALKRAQGVSHIPDNESEFGKVLRLHTPNDRTLLLLAHWQLAGRKFAINRVDIARDEVADDMWELGEYMQELWRTLRFRHGKSSLYREDWSDGFKLNFYVNSGQGRRVVNVYRKAVFTVRSELRFLKADAVTKAGLDDIHALRSADLSLIFYKHLIERAC